MRREQRATSDDVAGQYMTSFSISFATDVSRFWLVKPFTAPSMSCMCIVNIRSRLTTINHQPHTHTHTTVNTSNLIPFCLKIKIINDRSVTQEFKVATVGAGKTVNRHESLNFSRFISLESRVRALCVHRTGMRWNCVEGLMGTFGAPVSVTHIELPI